MSGHGGEALRLGPREPSAAFDRLITAALPEVFSRRYALFPSVEKVLDDPGQRGTVGPTRTTAPAGGARPRETLISVDRPHGYTYLIDDIHGRLRPFVRTV